MNAITTGLTTDGGYAEYMTAHAEALFAIPAELSSIDAAPLLCAGSTTLGAIRSSGARGGDLVAIHGLGGLGHLAVQWARKLGMRVCVLSRGNEKEELALELGAHHFIDTQARNGAKELAGLGGAKLIVATAPNSQEIAGLVPGLGPDGEILIVTFVNEPMHLSPALLMRGSRALRGWVGGDIRDSLAFGVLTGTRPMVETFPLAKILRTRA